MCAACEKPNAKDADGQPTVWFGAGCGPTGGQWSRWVGVAALHSLHQCLKQKKKKFGIRTRGADAALVAVGWRAGVWGHSRGGLVCKYHPKRTSQPPALHAQFPSRRVSREEQSR